MNMTEVGNKLKALSKSRYMLLGLLVGAVLLLFSGTGRDSEQEPAATAEEPAFSLEEQEKRLETALSTVAGVGEVSVMLALESGMERELAQDGEETLVVSAGSGTQKAVELRYVYPRYLGAVVICSGAASSRVRLDVTEAVSAVTGLSSDRIIVIQMKS